MIKHFTRFIITFTVFALFHLMFTQRAYAYLDPGTGSYILQMFIGLLVGGAFVIKLFWAKIISFFKSLSSRKGKNE